MIRTPPCGDAGFGAIVYEPPPEQPATKSAAEQIINGLMPDLLAAKLAKG